MSIDIRELLKIRPEELARKQHDALKEHAVKHLKSFAALLYDEKYEEALTWLFDSQAGDDHGCDNSCIYFGDTGLEDIGEVINRLKELKHKSKDE